MKRLKDSGIQKRYSQFGNTKHKWRTVLCSLYFVMSLCDGQETVPSELDPYMLNTSSSLSELSGGILSGGQTVWGVQNSPYLLRDDLLIEREAELKIEPGVEVRFAPMVGITVRGRISAVVSINNTILK